MLNKIYKLIKKYNNIVIARHIGVDPDALASQIALRDSIRLTFPKKNVYAVGAGSSKFNYLGKLDKIEEVQEKTLLIIVDTPDRKRVDITNFDKYDYKIKIDHHPYMETFCDLEYIDESASSASQLVLELINRTRLKMNKNIAETIFLGIASDTNRFLFSNSTHKTFILVGELLKKYDLNIGELYQNLYLRSMDEVRLEGYIAQNMKITENKVGYIIITNDIINKFKVDSASPGNMINNFNYIEELLVWVTITEDSKNDTIRVSIRSRGPEINSIAEKYSGGGHKYASGIRINNILDSEEIINELDRACQEYLNTKVGEETSEDQ